MDGTRREFLWAALGSLTFAGCGQQSGIFRSPSEPTSAQSDSTGSALTVAVSTTQTGAIRARANGSQIADWHELEDVAGGQLANLGQLEGEIIIFDGDLPASGQLRIKGADLKSSIGNYFFRLSAESGYIGGCIGKQNVPHLGLLLKDKKTDREIVNLHLCSWSEGSRRCFGIYNSATQWCVKSCSPTRDQMRNDLKGALIAAGLTAAIAVLIAAVVIAAAAPALAL